MSLNSIDCQRGMTATIRLLRNVARLEILKGSIAAYANGESSASAVIRLKWRRFLRLVGDVMWGGRLIGNQVGIDAWSLSPRHR